MEVLLDIEHFPVDKNGHPVLGHVFRIDRVEMIESVDAICVRVSPGIGQAMVL
jgi:hypothetical protein